jgi:hypothetical protein
MLGKQTKALTSFLGEDQNSYSTSNPTLVTLAL